MPVTKDDRTSGNAEERPCIMQRLSYPQCSFKAVLTSVSLGLFYLNTTPQPLHANSVTDAWHTVETDIEDVWEAGKKDLKNVILSTESAVKKDLKSTENFVHHAEKDLEDGFARIEDIATTCRSWP